MKGRNLYQFSYIVLCILFLQRLVSAQTPTPTPAEISEKPPTITIKIEEDLIHFGDLIDVDVIGSIEFDWRGTLNAEGFLNGVDFVENPIYALCRSEEEIAAEVSKGYSKILREPKVAVKILDRSNRPLSILYGAIKTPHRFQIKRPVFLNELLIAAGGLTEKASGEIQILRPSKLNCQQEIVENTPAVADDGEKRQRIVVARQDNGSNYINIKISDLLTGKKESNPKILSGDIVTVQEADLIYVIGGVANPKQIFSRSQITLSRAVASAGGVTRKADPKKVTIFRREGGETKIIEADLEKIKANADEDIILQAFDIVEVAQTGRESRKSPPILKVIETNKRDAANLPLRIID